MKSRTRGRELIIPLQQVLTHPHSQQGRKIPSWETRPGSLCVCEAQGPRCRSARVHPREPQGTAAPLRGVGEAANVWMPVTATQEGWLRLITPLPAPEGSILPAEVKAHGPSPVTAHTTFPSPPRHAPAAGLPAPGIAPRSRGG